jgi:hypothetical protein
MSTSLKQKKDNNKRQYVASTTVKRNPFSEQKNSKGHEPKDNYKKLLTFHNED